MCSTNQSSSAHCPAPENSYPQLGTFFSSFLQAPPSPTVTGEVEVVPPAVRLQSQQVCRRHSQHGSPLHLHEAGKHISEPQTISTCCPHGCVLFPSFSCNLSSLQDLYASRTLKHARKIVANPSHPGHSLFETLPSGRRLRSNRTKTSHHKNSFLPSAVSLINKAWGLN